MCIYGQLSEVQMVRDLNLVRVGLPACSTTWL